MYQYFALRIVPMAAGACVWWQPAHALTPGEIYERARAAVVKIRVQCVGEQGSIGSGFVVAAKGGTAYVVTNHHVAYGCKQPSQAGLEVAFEDRARLPATRIGGDRLTDVALISVPRKNAKPLPFAGAATEQPGRNQSIRPVVSDGVSVGADIVAIGFPLDLDLQPTVTRGIISAVGRNLGDKSEVLQFDATIDRGSSGGPLLNSNGEVVGVVFGGAGNRNLGFAVPHTIARVVVTDLVTTGQVRRNNLGTMVGVSILEGREASLRQRGAPIREGLLLVQYPVSTDNALGRPGGPQRLRLQNELARCDLIHMISWVRKEEDLAADCGGSRSCRAVRADRSLDIRSSGDWHNAMLWIPEATRAKISYVRYPQSKCDLIRDISPDVLKPPTLEQAEKLHELMQSEGTPGSVTVVLGPQSRYVIEGLGK